MTNVCDQAMPHYEEVWRQGMYLLTCWVYQKLFKMTISDDLIDMWHAASISIIINIII